MNGAASGGGDGACAAMSPRSAERAQKPAQVGNVLSWREGDSVVNLELTDEQAAVLTRTLELAISDVRMEICDTDSPDFKDGLRVEKSALQGVLSQLTGTAQ